MDLIDGLNIELNRAKELLTLYESIPTGGFGAMIIKQTIEHAELSMQTSNAVEMVKAYAALEKVE
ncbi:MAG: hypothetical protein MUO40_02695 [Anaerolineaceae bacterium]|nr:hypothetical protein [Anaerolineaceae bacterium]